MKTTLASSPHETSLSFSRRHFFNLRKKLHITDDVKDEADNDEGFLNMTSFSSSSRHFSFESDPRYERGYPVPDPLALKKKSPSITATSSKLRSALQMFAPKHNHRQATTKTRSGGRVVVGTLFGNRRGHVQFAFQEDPRSGPAFLIQLATPTSVLVREMASGTVRIALECDRKGKSKDKKHKKSKTKLLEEEGLWRTYCNGRKWGYALRRECGEEEARVLKALEVISMGAGVLPRAGGSAGETGEGADEGEMMYMRARFERVVGSRDSEAFHMVNPDGSGGPELSIYLLRV